MDNFEIYNDIAKRTGGDIYVGVVGPVRTGKSTFISRFMQTSIINNIENEYEKKRTIDEMPQSGAGKTVMTMQPKFIPSEAVDVKFGDGVSAKVRLVDCVGYAIDGANGFLDDGENRMVKTPWSDQEIPFEKAAEIGTQKVIADHSTIAVLVTTDGSITDIKRENYEKAEERVVNELKQNKKPFVVLLNSKNPNTSENMSLATSLQEKYGAPVMPVDIAKIGADEIVEIIKKILMEFPVNKINFNLPKWIQALSYDDSFIQKVMTNIKNVAADIHKMSDYTKLLNIFDGDEDIKRIETEKLDMSNGDVTLNIVPDENLYYKTLSKECETTIEDDFYLMKYLKELTKAKKEYDKIASALEQVKQSGYGVVNPSINDLELQEPEIITKNGNSSLKLKAKAPSLHIMRVDVESEICPAVGNVEQGGSLVSYMLEGLENNKQDIWNKNMFGKPMNELMKDTIDGKLLGLPEEVQVKMRKTLTKIVNERKGGLICILL